MSMASSAEKKDVPADGGATAAAAVSEKPAAAAPVPASAAEVPDPDEDDLDDLDDVLDEFNPTPAASGPGRPATAPPAPKPGSGGEGKAKAGEDSGVSKASGGGTKGGAAPSEAEAEAFASALERQMAALMGEIETSPEMQAQLDAMMAELGTGTAGGDSEAAKAAAARVVQEGQTTAQASGADAAFQATIQRTMERMQASGQQADAAAADAQDSSHSAETDMLEALMREMAAGGEGGDDDFSNMLLGMMEQLTNKEILYEPMKDLHAKFPAWMEANRASTPKDDLLRYEQQQALVTEIVARFERDGYSDDNPADREFIVERMQKMQAAGSPPADLVGDMKETEDALGDLGQGCAQQ